MAEFLLVGHTISITVACAGLLYLALTRTAWRVFYATVSLHFLVGIFWAALITRYPHLFPVFLTLTRFTTAAMALSFIVHAWLYWRSG